MKLLLDQGLPRSTVSELGNLNLDSIHVGDIGMASATDLEILQLAKNDDLIVVTLDSDFHTILAANQYVNPTVIRIRIEGLKSKELSRIISSVLESTQEEIKKGSAISVDEKGIRVHTLPLV